MADRDPLHDDADFRTVESRLPRALLSTCHISGWTGLAAILGNLAVNGFRGDSDAALLLALAAGVVATVASVIALCSSLLNRDDRPGIVTSLVLGIICTLAAFLYPNLN